MFHETIIKCGDVVIILVQSVVNASRCNNKSMGNKMKTQVPCGMDRGRGAHPESLAMTFDKILFQSTLDLNVFPIRDYDCTSNEVQVRYVIGITCKKDADFYVHVQR